MTRKIAYSGVFAAVITIFTMGAIPIPGGGYIHIGDSMIFLASFILPMPFAAIAAGTGSALADVILGYNMYALPTLIIKAVMAVIARLFIMRSDKTLLIMAGFLVSSLFMQASYMLYNTLIFGEEMSFIIFLMNMVQTIASLPVAYLLIKAVKKVPDLEEVRLSWRKK